MVTIIMPVSRDMYLPKVFHSLENLIVDKANTNLFVYVDGNWRLFEKTRNLVLNSKFAEKLCVYGQLPGSIANGVRQRRRRIANIHNEIIQNLKESAQDDELVFLLEDDTVIKPSTIQKLTQTLTTDRNIGFVTGVEIGRWGYEHVGAWRVDNVYDIQSVQSTPLEDGIQKIDAAGIYCTLMKKRVYMQHTFKPFEDALGPDFDMGIELRKMGYSNYIDFSVTCEHLTPKGSITVQNSTIVEIGLTRDSSSKNGWRTQVINKGS